MKKIYHAYLRGFTDFDGSDHLQTDLGYVFAENNTEVKEYFSESLSRNKRADYIKYLEVEIFDVPDLDSLKERRKKSLSKKIKGLESELSALEK